MPIWLKLILEGFNRHFSAITICKKKISAKKQRVAQNIFAKMEVSPCSRMESSCSKMANGPEMQFGDHFIVIELTGERPIDRMAFWNI